MILVQFFPSLFLFVVLWSRYIKTKLIQMKMEKYVFRNEKCKGRGVFLRFCTYPKCHLLSDAFLAINSLFQNCFFCGKILKNHKCMYYWFWYFTKSWCQLWYWYFWNHQFWYLFKNPWIFSIDVIVLPYQLYHML